METVSSTLEIEMNAATGSIFYKTHESEDISGALRFWVDGEAIGGVALMFRYRLTPRIEVLNFKHYLEALWPGVLYSGNGLNHASVAGAVFFKEANSAEKVLAKLQDGAVAEHLRDLIKGMFPGMKSKLEPEQFQQFLLEQVGAALLQNPVKKPKSAVVLTFGSKTKDLPAAQEAPQLPETN